MRNVVKSLVARLGEPVVRTAVKQAMGLLGEQFILGSTIEKAMEAHRQKSHKAYLYSYDMLGEAAMTADDAEMYFQAYQHSIAAIGKDDSVPLMQRPGISIKLSALHARYTPTQHMRCVPDIVDKVTSLVLMAKASNISVTLDAEELISWNYLLLCLVRFSSTLKLCSGVDLV